MKKVLISWDELLELKRFGSINDCDLTDWFDAQPDASPEGYDIVDVAEYEFGLYCDAPICSNRIQKGNVYRSRCHMRFILCEECYKEALSKMETTGDNHDC